MARFDKLASMSMLHEKWKRLAALGRPVEREQRLTELESLRIEEEAARLGKPPMPILHANADEFFLELREWALD